MREEFLDLGQVVQAEFTFIQNMIENDQVWHLLCRRLQRAPGCGGTDQVIALEGFFIQFVLKIVVLDDEKARFVHGC